MSASNPLPPLDAATEAALRESIRRWGVLTAILVDQHGETVDGHNRRRLAAEVGRACPEERINTPEDPGERAALLASLNDDRRPRMSVEQRREMVAGLRAQGHPLRAIAGAVGASKSQVGRDLAAAVPRGTADEIADGNEEPGDNVTPAPERVTGKDGRSHPATKPAKKGAKPAAERPPQQWGWKRLLRKAAKGLPYSLRKYPPSVREAYEMIAILDGLRDELDRYIGGREP